MVPRSDCARMGRNPKTDVNTNSVTKILRLDTEHSFAASKCGQT
jgi:hypothetical protein